MNRSVYAVAVGMGIASIAGCGGGGDDDSSATDATAPLESTPPSTAIAPVSTSSSDAGTSVLVTAIADTAAATTAPTETTEPSSDSDDLTPAAVASQLAEEGLGCEDYADAVVDPDETAMTLAPAVESAEGTCTINGVSATIGVFPDEDAVEMARAQIETVYRQMMVAFGIEELAWAFAGPDDRIWISYEDAGEGQTKPTDEQLAMLDDVADALDGEVFTFEP
jgi:hypothetical protein